MQMNGDTEALVNLIDKWSLWGQMLVIRHEARIDDYRAEQEAAAPMSPSDREAP